MRLELIQVDAFTRHLFGGNSAAVVVLDDWLDPALMQQIAMENNLSETVFVKPESSGWSIRWFTPQIEVDLCGHATLAAAYVLFKDGYVATDHLRFFSQGGDLGVAREGERLFLDFPARPGRPLIDCSAFAAAVGQPVVAAYQARDTLLILESQAAVAACSPDFAAVAALDTFAVIVSAPGEACDFVSRFFAPAAGIPEDPVTGSAHCTLIPYWAERLAKQQLHARQLSARGGELFCRLQGERVSIGGNCVEYLRGRLDLSALDG